MDPMIYEDSERFELEGVAYKGDDVIIDLVRVYEGYKRREPVRLCIGVGEFMRFVATYFNKRSAV